MTLRFGSSLRIRNKKQYDTVFSCRKRLYGKCFIAYYRSNALLHARLGVISSKRNVRFAVQRNRIRRIIKEQFRLNQEMLPGMDIVFIAKANIAGASNEELRQCANDLLKKLKILPSERSSGA